MSAVLKRQAAGVRMNGSAGNLLVVHAGGISTSGWRAWMARPFHMHPETLRRARLRGGVAVSPLAGRRH